MGTESAACGPSPMSAAPRTSLIVAVYERPRVLQPVLGSLARQTFRDFEVVVADDGSGPEIAQVVKDWASRETNPVRHVWQPNLGFRKTVIANRAVAESSGRYLVFIDGDCILHHRFIERHSLRARSGQTLSGRRVMLDAQLTSKLIFDEQIGQRIEQPSMWWRLEKAHDLRNGIYLPGAFGWRG